MKPLRLEVRGFTAFRERTVVDFEGRRLFVITGATGAGKSSLLDAITWALFGQVPRVNRGALKELIAHGEKEMSVLLDFDVRGRHYRVARRLPSLTGARLEEIVDGEPRLLSDRATDVTRRVEALLGGMDYATFTRAIVLPQGQFDSFLRGDGRERRDILSQLIGLEVWKRAGELARQRASDHRAQVTTLRALLDDAAAATPEALAAQRAELAARRVEEAALARQREDLRRLGDLARAEGEQRKAAAQAETEAKAAQADLDAARAAAEAATKRHEQAQAMVEDARAAAEGVAYDRDAHDRLRAQVALLDQRAAAEAAVETARHEVEGAQRALAEASSALVEAARAASEGRVASKARAAEAQAATRTLATVAGRAMRARNALATEIATAEADRARLEDEARALDQRIRDLDAVASSVRAAADDRARAEQHAARAARDVQAATKAAAQAAAAREQAEAAAEEARAALDSARALDAAAHIRAALKPGDVCPVCGEVIGKVTQRRTPAGLAAAERAHTAALAALREASAEDQRAAAEIAAAKARAKETARALDAATKHETAVHRQVEALGAAPGDLVGAVRAAKALLADGTKAITIARKTEAARREAFDAYRDAVARLPDGLEPVESKRATATVEELAEAAEAYRIAHVAQTDAERAMEQSVTREVAAKRDAETAERDHARAQRAETEARQRLASLGDVPGRAEDVRRALAERDARAAESERLAEALRVARETLASVAASLSAAQSAVEAQERRTEVRASAFVAASAARDEAHRAFVAAWAETIGAAQEATLPALRDAMERHEVDRQRVAEAIVRLTANIEVAETQIAQVARLRDDLAKHQAAADLAGAVGRELQGDRFIAFLLQESMHLLAVDASERLGDFTNGRYALVADGDEFAVIDRLNGDEQRSVKTLSGGETFLASLALALALSEHLPDISGTGGALSLDSLFLDEGFGALDPESLDLAVQGLETLAEGSRMIGVISHVEELAERLPDRIRVEKGARGSTVVC